MAPDFEILSDFSRCLTLNEFNSITLFINKTYQKSESMQIPLLRAYVRIIHSEWLYMPSPQPPTILYKRTYIYIHMSKLPLS